MVTLADFCKKYDAKVVFKPTSYDNKVGWSCSLDGIQFYDKATNWTVYAIGETMLQAAESFIRNAKGYQFVAARVAGYHQFPDDLVMQEV